MSDSNSPSTVGQAWADHFKTEADSYRLTEGLPFLRKFMRSPFIQLPYRYTQLPLGGRILEAGCGSGKFSLCFALSGYQVTALDFSAAILQNVAELRRIVEQEVGPLQLTLLQGDLENLGLGSNHFDLLINEGVIEHWLDHIERRQVLANMARVIKPGGVMAVMIPNGQHPYMSYWIKHSPAFLSAPPMVRYNPELLQTDLSITGLTSIHIDGIYAWRTIDQWPNTGQLYRILGGALQRFVPLPRSLRLRWGLHLIGMGRKL